VKEDEKDNRSYTSQLGKVKKLLEEDNVTPNIVVEQLGNNVSAILSVPTAIYSFLCAQ